MKLSTALSLIVTLAIFSYLRDSLGRSSFQGQVCGSKKKPAIPEQQLPVETRVQASNWACRLGLLPCPTWVRYRVSRVDIVDVSKQQAKDTEQEAFKEPGWRGFSMYTIRIWKSVSKMVLGQKQQPVSTEKQAMDCTCMLGLPAYPRWVRHRVSRVVTGKIPKQEDKGTEQEAFKGPCWRGISVRPIKTWKSVSKMVLGQEQQPVSTKKQAMDCSCRLGLFSCLKCIQYRISGTVVTEGPKQQPLGMTQKTFKGPWWLPRIREWVSKTDVHEKKLPVNAEHQESSWSRWLGLSAFPRWVRYWVSRIISSERMDQFFSSAFPLDQVCNYFAQGALVRLFLEVLFIVFICYLLKVAQGLRI